MIDLFVLENFHFKLCNIFPLFTQYFYIGRSYYT